MIYAIGDLHFDYSKEKPMDIFGQNWLKHEEKIMEYWKATVKDEDLVLLPGDSSWALRLEEAYEDLKRIDSLPGKKIISKGNHDYWWESMKKMNGLGLESISFLHNNSYLYGDTIIFGTRGWYPKDSENFNEDDEKIFKRELLRLGLSIDSGKGQAYNKSILMLHYPPFNLDGSPNEFVGLMKEHEIDICLYGHLHAQGHSLVQEGSIEGIDFHCVSSDFIDFRVKLIV